ncbi:MAG: hypothetical protein RIF46_02125, partial [Cyclobacteriaceae bacterium]
MRSKKLNVRNSLILLFCLAIGFADLSAQSNGRSMGSGDPNLDPDWIWYEEVAGGHDMWYNDGGTETQISNVQTPFFTSGNDLDKSSSPGEYDMYPEDGWILAYRDFGTSSAAPDVPFFALYNKYR